MNELSSAATTSFPFSGSAPSKIKLTCENCVRAKVKCSGQPGPCERCTGWRKLDCVFLEERKRGRPRLQAEEKKASLNKTVKTSNDVDGEDSEKKQNAGPLRQGTNGEGARNKVVGPTQESKLACLTSDCWAEFEDTNRLGTIPGPTLSPSSGLSFEQARVVEIFFDLYKNHASNRSCCRAWFSRQINKICGMLKAAQSLTALLSVIEWMNKHQILVASMLPPEQKAFADPDSGFMLPPMTSTKGPLLNDEGIMATGGAAPVTPQPLGTPQPHDPNIACIFLQYSRDERCFVRTNEGFVNLFGKDAAWFACLLDSLYGGILPWGADVFSNLLLRPIDTLLLIRVLAFRFQSLPRMMDATPITRTVQTSHLFTCAKADGSIVDCIVRFTHVEHISFQGVNVKVTATFEPYISSGTVTAREQCDAMVAAAQQQQPTVAARAVHSEKFEMRASTEQGSGSGSSTSPSAPPHFVEDLVIDVDDAFFSRPERSGAFKDEWMEDVLKWVDDSPRE